MHIEQALGRPVSLHGTALDIAAFLEDVRVWRGGAFVLPDDSSIELPPGALVQAFEDGSFVVKLPDRTLLRLTAPEDDDCSYLVETYGFAPVETPSDEPPASSQRWSTLRPPPSWFAQEDRSAA